MADKKITDFPEISSIGADDVFLVGGTNATYKAKLAAVKNSIGAVSKAGDTMTGNLNISKTEPFLVLKNPSFGNMEFGIEISTAGQPGIYSTGYWDGSQFVASWSWFAYRDGNGKILYSGVWNGEAIPVDKGGTGATGVSGDGTYLTVAENVGKGNSAVHKLGPVGVLSLQFSTTVQLEAYDLILTAASGYRPNAEYNGFVCDSSGKGYPVYFTQDGILRTRVDLPVGNYFGNIAFFAL